MMISNSMAFRSIMVMAAVGVLGACGGSGSGEADVGVVSDTGMSGMDMSMDSATMQRHAAEMDSMVTELRAHVAEMRQLPREQWHARMDQHAPLAARMLGMMERQMREMDMGMGMDADHMGEMMGMTGDEHEAMLRDMTALRMEVGQLQTAAPEEVRAQMPAHLERLERMIETMEASAEHMGSVRTVAMARTPIFVPVPRYIDHMNASITNVITQAITSDAIIRFRLNLA